LIYLGNFSFNEAYYGDESQDGSEKDGPMDEDADVDESEEEMQKKKSNEQVLHFELLFKQIVIFYERF